MTISNDRDARDAQKRSNQLLYMKVCSPGTYTTENEQELQELLTALKKYHSDNYNNGSKKRS